MIPIRDHNPTSRPAVVTPIIIAINAVVFLFVQPTFAGTSARAEVEQTQFFACRAAIPYEVTHGESVLEAVDRGALGGRNAAVIAALQSPRPGSWEGCPGKSVLASIVTSMFLHGGWLHIIGNMLFLWVFGNNVEDRLGRARFVLFYLVAGLAAAYAQSFTSAGSIVPMVGASGAVAGILGAYLLMFPNARVTTLVIFFFITAVEVPAIVVLGLWFVLQLFQSVGSVTGDVGGVAYMAHVGGFVAGMLLLLLLRPRRRQTPPAFYP